MKNFKDLIFKNGFNGILQAEMNFSNGYGISVLLGKGAYSNGIDTYEIAVLYDNKITYNTYITDNVIAYASQEEVTEIMKKIQQL